jgi:Ni/Co efflux regulator RcnB
MRRAHHEVMKATTTFKASAAVCAVLAGTLGFSSLASAQDWGDRHGRDHRVEQRHERGDHERGRDGGREGWRGERRQEPRFIAQQNHGWNNGWDHGQQAYRGGARFSRGAYLPNQYRNRAYYVNDWRAYNGLYAPPYGQQWVNVDGQFLLVALASGLIANALLN